MILFASGRTDIPAFYLKWFLNRLRAGFVLVRNPYYSDRVTRYRISPDVVDCIVFCTKNPAPLLFHLDELSSFSTYFFVSLTPYGKEVEPNVPAKEDVIAGMIQLSNAVGKERVCWRYDPVFISPEYPVSAHIRSFRQMSEKLRGSTDRCVISFIDLYEKTKKNFPGIHEVSDQDQRFLSQSFSVIAAESGMTVSSCAEKNDLSAFGVENTGCVSPQVIEKAAGIKLINVPHERPLRKYCNCMPMRDIGTYNTCPHGCRYCYANYDMATVAHNMKLHDDSSPFLIGTERKTDIITDANQKSWRDTQLLLL